MMRYYQRRKRPTQVSSDLPFEIIVEILSWLPVLSLLRFKCVCKQWFLLLRDYKFIAKHRDRTCYTLPPYYYHCERDKKSSVTVCDENFVLKCCCSGLSLEKSTTSQVCRIRNPATRQVLYLPDAQVCDTEFMDLGFNSLTGECKVSCVYFNMAQKEVGVEVITVGKDETWRPLHKQNQNWLQRGKAVLTQSCCGEDKVEWGLHLPEIITEGHDMCLQIHSLDLWSECLTTNTLPQGVFVDLENLRTFLWENRPAVADIVGGDLHILVLVDFKEHKWSQNKIIVPLKNLKADDTILTDKFDLKRACSNTLKFRSGAQLISYDMETKTVMVSDSLELLKKRIALLKSTLMSLKEMRSEINGVRD